MIDERQQGGELKERVNRDRNARAHSAASLPPSALPSTALPPTVAATDASAMYRPFYERSLCAAAFSPDGQLLVVAGTDDQHTIGVWCVHARARACALSARPRRAHRDSSLALQVWMRAMR